MSTRKSINKQNSDAAVTSSQEAPALRSKPQQSQDAGSESSDCPTTPTSKESNSLSAIVADSKRKRRTNSTQGISTPKRSTTETGDSIMDETNDKNASKELIEEKNPNSLTDSPRTRKRGNAVIARKSNVGIDTSKAIPLRTSLRAANRKNLSPVENSGTSKTGATRGRKKAGSATPIKRERVSPIAFENEADEVSDVKRIKVEKEEDEPEEEILMEIRTEILEDIIDKDEVEVIVIKGEKQDSNISINDLKYTSELEDEMCKYNKSNELNPSIDDSKGNSILIPGTPPKAGAVTITESLGSGDAKKTKGLRQTKRPARRKPVKATTIPQRGKKMKIEKKDQSQVPKRPRGRKPTIKTVLPKIVPPTRKPRKPIVNRKTPLKKPLVPENTENIRTQVSEVIESDETITSEPTELIFSTTTDPLNRDNVEDQPKEPLLIDTTTQNSDGKESIPSTECTAGSEKSASLSPVELESEGVSAVCVKEYYREPEFLENNLGIEKDPELGGIVQNVDKKSSECMPRNENQLQSNTNPESTSEGPVSVAMRDLAVADKITINVEVASKDIKSPVHSEGNESDSLKEGELLVLEDSTEEENTLSQKASVEANTEDLLKVNDANLGNEKVKVKEPEYKQEAVNAARNISESKNYSKDEIKEENVEVKVENLEIEVACENSKEPRTNSNNDKSDVGKVNTYIENSQIQPDQILLNGTVDGEMHEGKGNEKEAVDNDANALEIDSGVSDVAENNSNDPNEDLSVLQSENQKHEMSDSDNAVNTVMLKPELETKNLTADNVQEMKELIDVEKDAMETDESKDIPLVLNRKVQETPETLKEKENHLKTLGLLTIKAADEAKIEKQKRRHQLHISTASSSNSSCGSRKSNGNNSTAETSKAGNSESLNGSGNNENGNKAVQEYTGTLKTVIKLNRPANTNPTQICDKKKTNGNSNGQNYLASHNRLALLPASSSNSAGRHPLKITLQKGRGRAGNTERNANGAQNSNEDTYYTIQNESETGTQETVTHGRKSHHYRSNSDHGPTTNDTTSADKKEVLIPEKASSFAIHPGRLCSDQCFYCGGKFGLYDTPCHVAQLKSSERQKKILESEEKLTVDNCLCDACFRHLDRRANATAAQKKRLSAPTSIESSTGDPLNTTPGTENPAEAGNGAVTMPPATTLAKSTCFITNCGQRASHTFRRKGFRKTIRKLLGDDIDLTNMGGRLPICDKHYEIIIQCLECALCKRRLIRNHMHHITQDIQLLESRLVKQGIPVKLSANPAVCKLCRYFTNLLLKPPDGKTQKAQFVKNYRKRLLHFHNIQQSDDDSEAEEQNEVAEKAKTQPSTTPLKRGRKPKPIPSTVSNPAKLSPASSEDGNSNDVQDLGTDASQSALATSGQMQLDNDVMVDYDVPVLCDSPSPPVVPAKTAQPSSKLQAILQGGTSGKTNDDISLALRSNPNISMRELFPGEEEMGLQVNVPFGSSSSQRTPEGWTRVQTFLQYDEPTRRLWEDLQKPYGNQSSFVRHLILLEKFYRNGDLVLSQNASTNATAYSETVQNRLTSYDHCIPATKTARGNPAAATIATASTSKNITEPQQLLQLNRNSNVSTCAGNVSSRATGNNSRQASMMSVPDPIRKLHNNLTITITPKTKLIPEAVQPTSFVSTATSTTTTTTSGSILKSNLLSRKNSAIEIIPLGSGPNHDTNAQSTPFLLTKQQKILAAANQLMGEEKTSSSPVTMTTISSNQSQLKSVNLPPELISINRSNPGSLLIASRNSAGNSAPIRPKPHSNHPLQPQYTSHRQGRLPPAIIKLPGTLTPQERMSSKHWRPTLMPISSGPVKSAPGVLYQTADGRKLPSLVQVQSGGKPFLISIHDYNRMCILRREKLMRDQIMRNGKVAGNISSNSGNSLLKGALSSGVATSSASGSSLLVATSINSSISKSMLHQGKQW